MALYFDSRGDWIAFSDPSGQLFTKGGEWIGEVSDARVFGIDGYYLAEIVADDRLLSRINHNQDRRDRLRRPSMTPRPTMPARRAPLAMPPGFRELDLPD